VERNTGKVSLSFAVEFVDIVRDGVEGGFGEYTWKIHGVHTPESDELVLKCQKHLRIECCE